MNIVLNIVSVIIISLILYFYYNKGVTIEKENELLKENYSKLLSQKKSSEVRLGQISENLAPFLKDFKYDPKRTHFLGNPIDYIIFEEDKVIFLEIKSGEAKLSQGQKKIKEMIKSGSVEWDEMRIN